MKFVKDNFAYIIDWSGQDIGAWYEANLPTIDSWVRCDLSEKLPGRELIRENWLKRTGEKKRCRELLWFVNEIAQ